MQIKTWRAAAEKVTSEAVYGRKKPQPGDVTIRTLEVNHGGSSSDAHTELHVEIAEINWPKNPEGADCSVEEATIHFKGIASQISEEIVKLIKKPGSFNVWVTPYRATGWAAFKTDKV